MFRVRQKIFGWLLGWCVRAVGCDGDAVRDCNLGTAVNEWIFQKRIPRNAIPAIRGRRCHHCSFVSRHHHHFHFCNSTFGRHEMTLPRPKTMRDPWNSNSSGFFHTLRLPLRLIIVMVLAFIAVRVQSFITPSSSQQKRPFEKPASPSPSLRSSKLVLASSLGDGQDISNSNVTGTDLGQSQQGVFQPTVGYEDLDEWFNILSGMEDEKVDKKTPFPKAAPVPPPKPTDRWML